MTDDLIAIAAAGGFLVLLGAYRARVRARPSAGYDSVLAYHRAGMYFCACFVISYATGVLGRILREPVVPAGRLEDPAWAALTGAAVAVIVIAYGIVWPMGTLTYGRALHLPSVLGFGLLWGISEGHLFASFWAVTDRLLASDVLVVAVSYAAIAAWSGPWHLRYWDVHVAPEHNIPEWNARKVLFAHTPNLLVSLTHLAVFGDLAIFVALQTLGLMLSTYFMRFPRYGAPGLATA